ncbi:uncharacterized protein LOC116852588 isoform X2 [Odontomachus brunneus]|nr:uncharacterized protein LOC116852588 isoform X2 [Odontomachus brunneus]
MFLKEACVQGNSVSNIPSLTLEEVATSYSDVSMKDDYTPNLINIDICYDETSQKFKLVSETVDVQMKTDFISQQSLNSHSDYEIQLVGPLSRSKSTSVSCSITTQVSDEVKNLVTKRKEAAEDILF